MSADVDPFSRSFTQQSSGDQTQMSSSPASGDASVHPMVRLSIEQYFVKGVVTSPKGSLAIISFPGGDDYFLYVGDLIGNDSHSLKSISTDKITVSKEDELTATNIIKANKNSLQYDDVLIDSNIAKVSLVGVGMRTHAGIASEAFKALAENDVNIQMISTSEIKITIVINEVNTDKAVKCLHETFNLDK